MLTIPFLTDLDPPAAVKGSRDPLGVQTIWTRLGRPVVGSLTAVSTSVRDFTTLVLGYYFAERVATEIGGDGILAVFLKWEQLAAYSRGEINGDWKFRGVNRVKKNLQDGSRLRLSTDSSAQILSNQKTYARGRRRRQRHGRREAARLGLGNSEIEPMATAFEHDDLKAAVAGK